MDLLQCLGIDKAWAFAVSLCLFVLAYILYRVLLFFFRRLFHKDGISKLLVETFRFPVLVILFEIAAITSIDILGIKEQYEASSEHAVTIVIIGTIGWLLASITHALYRYFYTKYHEGKESDTRYRTIITQILFLYRLVMLLIFAITLAAILLTFPYIKSVGIGILSSAGIAGIAIGVAARPILLNIMAGFQVAMTRTIKIGDAVIIENDFARIETIHLTHVIARTWDLRRIVLPISYFIDQPFQNWDTKNSELIGSIFVYCDYTASVGEIRKKVGEIIQSHPNWNTKIWKLHVTNCTEKTIELRIMMTANDAGSTFELRCFVREKLIEFLQKEYPHALPCVRFKELNGANDELSASGV